MNILKACYDWRVITALAAVGVGVFFLSPGILVATLPLLLLAVCPLSMMLMMRTMGGHAPSTMPAAATDPGDRTERLGSQLAAARQEQQRLARELDALEAESGTAVAAQAAQSPRP